MTRLDPPAAAARRQWVIDRMIEDLVGWGCPLEHAPDRATQLLGHALDAGYALPTVLQPAPRSGPGSTDEGRRAARAVFEAARRAREDAQRVPALPPSSPSQGQAGMPISPDTAQGN